MMCTHRHCSLLIWNTYQCYQRGLLVKKYCVATITQSVRSTDLKAVQPDERGWTNELHLFNFTEKVSYPCSIHKAKSDDLSFELSQ